MHSRTKIEQWINIILHEDGDNLSQGSIQTLHMIRRELPTLEHEAWQRGKSDLEEAMESDY